jgi:hypothetical protein
MMLLNYRLRESRDRQYHSAPLWTIRFRLRVRVGHLQRGHAPDAERFHESVDAPVREYAQRRRYLRRGPNPRQRLVNSHALATETVNCQMRPNTNLVVVHQHSTNIQPTRYTAN